MVQHLMYRELVNAGFIIGNSGHRVPCRIELQIGHTHLLAYDFQSPVDCLVESRRILVHVVEAEHKVLLFVPGTPIFLDKR